MASVIYTHFKAEVMKGNIDLDTGGDDIRVALVMTNTTCDTEEDVTLMNGFTTLDEMDGSGYSRQALANEVVNKDNTNNRGEFDADNTTFSSLGNGTRAVQGALIYKHVTDDTDSIPICFVDFAADQNPGGSDFTIQWDAEGILQST